MIEESTNKSESTNHLLRVEAGAVILDGVLNIPTGRPRTGNSTS